MNKIIVDPGSSGEYGWHSIQKFLRCPRLYHESKNSEDHEVSPALVKGSLVHLGLAQHYSKLKAEQTNEDPDIFEDPFEAISIVSLRNAGESSLWMELASEASDMVQAYLQHWPVEQWRIVAVEQVLRADVGGYPYTQRMDLLVHHNGRYWIVDHKTTGRISKNSQERYILDGQFIGYEVMGKARFGAEWGGVILNLIGFDGNFARVPSEMRPGAVEGFKQTLLHAHRGIEACTEAGQWPQVFTGAFGCNAPYPREDGKYRCQFFEKCQYGV